MATIGVFGVVLIVCAGGAAQTVSRLLSTKVVSRHFENIGMQNASKRLKMLMLSSWQVIPHSVEIQLDLTEFFYDKFPKEIHCPPHGSCKLWITACIHCGGNQDEYRCCAMFHTNKLHGPFIHGCILTANTSAHSRKWEISLRRLSKENITITKIWLGNFSVMPRRFVHRLALTK